MPSEQTIRLRPAEPGDVAPITDVVCMAYAKWIPIIGRKPRPMTVDYEKAVQEHDFDLAHLDSRLIGLIETILHDDHLWIENIAVRPEDQGRGVGQELLRHAEKKALSAGLREIRLLTNAAFETNLNLYGKIGYVTDRREPFMGGITVYMRKQIG
ncbi:GNAT family N-acetyltransferase [Mesorhizobium qingshengii]|uniref:Acetyltransferase (GNAT) family protein n=1 Tax=Mesorhizobium qingshengii TaxID=1165689 RepID=A0A1G5ZA84_9HYPH|nr:GNAT family N-acetyltransferase [Mesorhizobium qingshengii]SDA91477.1 Acetyltransferase (GNAT) family protein [Mesorhizobium qingshengii]